MTTTLYKKARKSEKVQQWTIELQDNRYRVVSGFVDQGSTTSKWTTCSGKSIGNKNETSPEAQAKLEVEAKIRKKKKEGYGLDKDLASRAAYFEPMLAAKYMDRLGKVEYPVFVQPKLNGFRCIFTKDGPHTRKGEKYSSIPHIEEVLKPIFDKYPEAILDGELFNPVYNTQLNELAKIIAPGKVPTPESLERSEQIVQYHVYDCLNVGTVDIDSAFTDRCKTIDNHLTSRKRGHDYIHGVPTDYATSEAEVLSIYDGWLAKGYEGAMVRIPSSPYVNGRSTNLLKVKPKDDDEFLIIDILEGIGNKSGRAATIVLRMKAGRLFEANCMGSFEVGAEILRNKKDYIGKQATIYYNGFTGLGIPNFAQFNPATSMVQTLDRQ